MRLLFVTSDFPSPHDPCKGIFNLYLARALARRNDVRVVAPRAWVNCWKHGNKADATNLDGVTVHYPTYYYTPRVLRTTYGWFLWQSIRRTVWKLIGSSPPDAVLAYWVHPHGAVAVRIARLLGIPSVVIVGGSDVLLLPHNRRRRRCVISVLRDVDAVLAVSQDLKDKIVDFGISPEKVHVWHQGVDLTRFFPGDRKEARQRLSIPQGARTILWVGRMVAVKGVDVLLHAYALVRAKGVDSRLYLVGDGPLRSSLELLSGRLGLQDNVSFVGARLHDDLPDWYRAADMMVLPSWSEGLPNVLRESLACGTPFVASRVGGIPDLAVGTNGRLVEPGQPTALAHALVEALADCESDVRTTYPGTGWDESADSLLNVLMHLVSLRLKKGLSKDGGPRALGGEVGSAPVVLPEPWPVPPRL
jgi:glycosyltransferase involved in cell wall biosynthesis